MQIMKFPPQHQNKCYCRKKRECNVNKHINKTDESNHKNKKHYFIKTRNPCCVKPSQPSEHQFNYKSHPTAMSSQFSTMQIPNQRFPNQFDATSSCNQETNPITQNILTNKTSTGSDIHRVNHHPIQFFNAHSVGVSTVNNNVPDSKLFNVIYDRYEKLREIETFRAENANECISVLNQQTNHNRVPNKSVTKHVCLHRYRNMMEPTISNGRGESKCELCEKWCGMERLKSTVTGGRCCIVDRIDSSGWFNGIGGGDGEGADDCKIILEVQNLNISSEAMKPKMKQTKKNRKNRSWHLMEQGKSLALNQQCRH